MFGRQAPKGANEEDTYVLAERIQDPYDKKISYTVRFIRNGHLAISLGPKVMAKAQVEAFAAQKGCPYNIRWC